MTTEAKHLSDTEDYSSGVRRRWRWAGGRWLWACLVLAVVGAGGGALTLGGIVWYFGRGLPDYAFLQSYEPPVSTRLYAGDGVVLSEFARESRVFVPIEMIPDHLKQAFLSAEDRYFYQHFGVNPLAIFRAAVQNLQGLGRGERLKGASTITQQVAKNFLLTNQRSLIRKIKEAILAVRIERAIEKDRILELYLNEIYLGQRSFGVAAAVRHYFDKPLTQITLAEAAYLASLPKGPNNYHPAEHTQAGLERRSWVLRRMLQDGFITKEQHARANQEPLVPTRMRTGVVSTHADYFVEEVRRTLLADYGPDFVYGQGLTVRTTLDSRLQTYAQQALRKGLYEYDRRHGYRGPVARLDLEGNPDWPEAFRDIVRPGSSASSWEVALVVSVASQRAELLLQSGKSGYLPLRFARWARKQRTEAEQQTRRPGVDEILAELGALKAEDVRRVTLGPRIQDLAQILEVGDVILVSAAAAPEAVFNDPPRPFYDPNATRSSQAAYRLEQAVAVNGGLVALDPHTGRVLALVGGWRFAGSQYNRVTQALRQPGSAFKPFVYLTALETGFTPATRILDAPVTLALDDQAGKWRPENYTNRYYGPSLMRVGVERSRNLMTVRLAQAVGIENIAATAKRLQLAEDFPPYISSALGTQETSLLRLTAAYASFTNGGKKITPTLIDQIQDRYGKTLFKHDQRTCEACQLQAYVGQKPPFVGSDATQIIDPVAAYQVTTMLEGVIQRGTGRRVGRVIARPLAGKTGTTDNSFDAWFVGFSPDLVCGVFVGFDQPHSLGMYTHTVQETGSTVAAPIFADFMSRALAHYPRNPFRTPPGIRFVKINAQTGGRAREADRNTSLEAFRSNTEPKSYAASLLIRENQGNQPQTQVPQQQASEAQEEAKTLEGLF